MQSGLFLGQFCNACVLQDIVRHTMMGKVCGRNVAINSISLWGGGVREKQMSLFWIAHLERDNQP